MPRGLAKRITRKLSSADGIQRQVVQAADRERVELSRRLQCGGQHRVQLFVLEEHSRHLDENRHDLLSLASRGLSRGLGRPRRK